ISQGVLLLDVVETFTESGNARAGQVIPLTHVFSKSDDSAIASPPTDLRAYMEAGELRSRAARHLALLLPGHTTDVVHFLCVVSRAVGAENIVEPQWWFRGVSLLPRVPRINRLRLAGYETPVQRADFVFLEEAE